MQRKRRVDEKCYIKLGFSTRCSLPPPKIKRRKSIHIKLYELFRSQRNIFIKTKSKAFVRGVQQCFDIKGADMSGRPAHFLLFR